jgi:hypothetical protein
MSYNVIFSDVNKIICIESYANRKDALKRIKNYRGGFEARIEKTLAK